tara:strand:- start:1483 stop:2046 length:564 start_codon:yes stop_codon:yes gene_type:complete
MIALPQALPFIRIGSASLALCQKDWLTETLTNATRGTDVPAWLAEDISRGVERFLSNHYKGTVIDSDELFARIEKTLSQFGLSDVAENIDKTPPPVRISLSELARRAGTGYELVFFQLLQDQLSSATTGGVLRVECHGIKPCVKRLVSTKKWSKRCDHLKDEITDFLNQARDQASTIRPEMSFMIAS